MTLLLIDYKYLYSKLFVFANNIDNIAYILTLKVKLWHSVCHLHSL